MNCAIEHDENVNKLAKFVVCGAGTIIWLSDKTHVAPAPDTPSWTEPKLKYHFYLIKKKYHYKPLN